jgi:polyisoprenoid-binding protein YceI
VALTSGSYGIGPDNGRLLLHTSRQGVAAKAGHDLTIEATRWSGVADVDVDRPDASHLTVSVEVAGLEVREGTGGVKPLTDKDRADIKRLINDKILVSERSPTIEFSSTDVSRDEVRGELAIAGQRRPALLRLTIDESTSTVTARAMVLQSEYGIKPYTGFFGALKVADAVDVEAQVTLIQPTGT